MLPGLATLPSMVEPDIITLNSTVSVSIPAKSCCRLSSVIKLPLCTLCDTFFSTLISDMLHTGHEPGLGLITLGCMGQV